MFDAKKLLDAMLAASQSPGPTGPATGGTSQGAGGLNDVLGSVLGKLQPGQGGSAGGLGGLLGSVFGQATQGLQNAARDSGAGAALDKIVGGVTGGQTSGDLAGRLRDIVSQNQFAAGGALGSLAGLFLGTKAGRGLAVDTAKVGGLALIGGLAYQAWLNYQQGKPPVDLGQAGAVSAPPEQSPFGSTGNGRVDQENAALLLRAMIGAAAADGTIDDTERGRIVGGLRDLGLDPEAARFLDEEFATPASPEDLAAAVGDRAMAAQVYTAARLTIDPDHPAETAYLASLAESLGLDEQLVAHIDAAAESAKVQA